MYLYFLRVTLTIKKAVYLGQLHYSSTGELVNSNKTELIKEMLEMQPKFIADEQAGKFETEDYYISEGKQYRKRYQGLLLKCVKWLQKKLISGDNLKTYY